MGLVHTLLGCYCGVWGYGVLGCGVWGAGLWYPGVLCMGYSPFLAGFVVCVCGQGSPPYPAIPGLVCGVRSGLGFPLTLACRGGWGSAGWCFPGWGT